MRACSNGTGNERSIRLTWELFLTSLKRKRLRCHDLAPWGIERYVEWIFMRKLEYVNGQWSLYSIENLVLLFIKTFQDSSALLPSWNTMEQWELVFFPYLKLSAWGNIFAVIARQWTILSYFEAFLKKLYKNIYYQLQIQLKKFWIKKLKGFLFSKQRG